MDTWITFPPPLHLRKRIFAKAKESTAVSFAFSVIRGAVRGAVDAAGSVYESLSDSEPRNVMAEIVQLHLIAAERGLVRGLWSDHPAHQMYQVLVGALCSASDDASIAHLTLGKIADEAFAEIAALRSDNPEEWRYLLEELRGSWHFANWNDRRVDHLRFMQAAIQETGMSTMLAAIKARGGRMPETMRVHFDNASADIELSSAANYAQALVDRCGGVQGDDPASSFLTVIFGAIRDESDAHTKRFTIV